MNRINSFDIEKKLVPLLQYYTKYSVIFSKKKKKSHENAVAHAVGLDRKTAHLALF